MNLALLFAHHSYKALYWRILLQQASSLTQIIKLGIMLVIICFIRLLTDFLLIIFYVYDTFLPLQCFVVREDDGMIVIIFACSWKSFHLYWDQVVRWLIGCIYLHLINKFSILQNVYPQNSWIVRCSLQSYWTKYKIYIKRKTKQLLALINFTSFAIYFYIVFGIESWVNVRQTWT